jgi:hypothetical protein
VPNDLKLNADEEVFTIEVSWDTRELYGKVTGTQQILICRP